MHVDKTAANASLFLPADRVETALERCEMGRPFGTKPIPGPFRRFAERALMKTSRLSYEETFLSSVIEVRRALMGAQALGPPKFLVRVDEFPHYLAHDRPAEYGIETARRFHDVMLEGGVQHLMALVPQLTADPLNPDAVVDRPLGSEELDHIARMRAAGVAFAQHGTTHRTRRRDPRRHSELCGLAPDELGASLDRGLAALRVAGVEAPRVFVPPFNRFDADQWPVLAERYDVVCGGPETVRLLGFHGSPLFRENALYLPAYPPFYGTATDILPAAERLISAEAGTWIPIVLHIRWEADAGWAALERLARRIGPYSVDWHELLRTVRSRLDA